MLYSARPNLYTHHQLFKILRYMGGKVGGPRLFFVSKFTLNTISLKFHLIWEVDGPHPFLVSKFISTTELYVQIFVVVHAFIEEISAEKYETDTLCF